MEDRLEARLRRSLASGESLRAALATTRSARLRASSSSLAERRRACTASIAVSPKSALSCSTLLP
eukprot:3615123-Pleurochrysis_carterae.AAC.5